MKRLHDMSATAAFAATGAATASTTAGAIAAAIATSAVNNLKVQQGVLPTYRKGRGE